MWLQVGTPVYTPTDTPHRNRSLVFKLCLTPGHQHSSYGRKFRAKTEGLGERKVEGFLIPLFRKGAGEEGRKEERKENQLGPGEARGSQVQGHLYLFIKFGDSLGYTEEGRKGRRESSWYFLFHLVINN